MSLTNLINRLNYQGGNSQQRVTRDKLHSMKTAAKHSYHAAVFNKYLNDDVSWKGLFNPVTKNENFDTKMLSVEWEANYNVGDIVKWQNTDTYWIIFLQDRTELAYFRGECRKCDYELKWVDGNRQEQKTLVSVIGPSVPTIRTSSSMQASVAQDFPNANLKILASATEENKKFFHRYQTLLLKNITYKIEEIDDISMPGVIQINATEYYTDLIENDVEENLRNAWNVQPIYEYTGTEYMIEGPEFIKPKYENEYSTIIPGGYWYIKDSESSNSAASILEYDVHQQAITIVWDSMLSGKFTLCYHVESDGRVYEKNVIVESLV